MLKKFLYIILLFTCSNLFAANISMDDIYGEWEVIELKQLDCRVCAGIVEEYKDVLGTIIKFDKDYFLAPGSGTLENEKVNNIKYSIFEEASEEDEIIKDTIVLVEYMNHGKYRKLMKLFYINNALHFYLNDIEYTYSKK